MQNRITALHSEPASCLSFCLCPPRLTQGPQPRYGVSPVLLSVLTTQPPPQSDIPDLYFSIHTIAYLSLLVCLENFYLSFKTLLTYSCLDEATSDPSRGIDLSFLVAAVWPMPLWGCKLLDFNVCFSFPTRT